MEIVQQENKTQSVSSNSHQFEDIDSSDDDSSFSDSYQFDDDDMESSDDDSTRSASKRTSKMLDSSESPDEKVMKSMSKRKLASMSTSTDEDDDPAGIEKKNLSPREEYHSKNPKRISAVGDQSIDIERYSKRGNGAQITRKIEDGSIEGKYMQKKRKYSHGNSWECEEPNREMELQRRHSADIEGISKSSDDAIGIKEYRVGQDTNTKMESNGKMEIRSAREQLRDLYRKDKKSKGDEGTSTKKKFRGEDEIPSARDHQDEDEIPSAREPRDEVHSTKEHRAKDRMRSAKKHREEGGDQSARGHQDEDRMRTSREHSDEDEVRTAGRHRDEEYRRKREVGGPRYLIRDKRRYVDYGYARDKFEERPRRSFVERHQDGYRSEGKQRHHSWHPDRGQSDIDVRPRRGDGERYSDVDRRSERDWYLVRPRSEHLKIKPCDFFNTFGFCRHKSGHKSKSGTRCILHICRTCFYSQRAKEYHSEKDCHLLKG